MVNAMLGPVWEEPVKDAPARKWYRFLLSLGALGDLVCRIVENPKRENENAPTHLVFHSPVADGEDVRLGALWPHENAETKAKYLMGTLDLAALGALELKGGAKLDLRLLDGKVNVRLSAVKERRSEKSPTHQLWRTKPRKAAPAPAPAPSDALPPDADDGEGEEGAAAA